MIYLSKGVKETEKLAGFLLRKIKKLKPRKAIIVALEGELGAGKTVFVKGMAKVLKVKTKIKSPTFNLMKHYLFKSGVLYHLDCYRLKDHRDLKVFGIKEIFNNPKNIVLVEWSDRVKKILPTDHIKIHIDHISKNKRKITVDSPPSLKLRKGTSSLNEEMPALRSSEGAKK